MFTLGWHIDTCYEWITPEERKRLLQYETQEKMWMLVKSTYNSEDWFLSKRNKPIRDEKGKIFELEYNPYPWAQEWDEDHIIFWEKKREMSAQDEIYRAFHFYQVKDMLIKQGYTMIENWINNKSIPDLTHIHFIKLKKFTIQELIDFLQEIESDGINR